MKRSKSAGRCVGSCQTSRPAQRAKSTNSFQTTSCLRKCSTYSKKTPMRSSAKYATFLATWQTWATNLPSSISLWNKRSSTSMPAYSWKPQTWRPWRLSFRLLLLLSPLEIKSKCHNSNPISSSPSLPLFLVSSISWKNFSIMNHAMYTWKLWSCCRNTLSFNRIWCSEFDLKIILCLNPKLKY